MHNGRLVSGLLRIEDLLEDTQTTVLGFVRPTAHLPLSSPFIVLLPLAGRITTCLSDFIIIIQYLGKILVDLEERYAYEV